MLKIISKIKTYFDILKRSNGIA